MYKTAFADVWGQGCLLETCDGVDERDRNDLVLQQSRAGQLRIYLPCPQPA